MDTRAFAAPFATTHWSVVLAAGAPTAAADAALESLCRSYWYPLYAYVRRAGHSPENAKDLTQDFFARLLKKNYVALAQRERGRFRSFLLSSLKNFLATEYHRQTSLKNGGGQTLIPIGIADAEERFAGELIERETPETLYDRRWALTLLDGALRRLREEYATSGQATRFEELKAFVWGEKSAATYADIAAQFNTSEEAVKKTVQRLRRQFRELLRAEIAQTVSTIVELEEELRHLIQILRG